MSKLLGVDLIFRLFSHLAGIHDLYELHILHVIKPDLYKILVMTKFARPSGTLSD